MFIWQGRLFAFISISGCVESTQSNAISVFSENTPAFFGACCHAFLRLVCTRRTTF